MNTSRAFGAGVLGGLVMTIITAIARAAGMPVNIEAMLGSMLGLAPAATGTWLLGLLMHLVLSGLIALLYAWGFERVTHRAGWQIGVAFSVVHIIIAGLFMAMLPAIHPMIPQMMAAPGAFMINMGAMGVLFLIVEHVIYGAIVGGVYAPEVRRVRTYEEAQTA
ncbi:MAG: hypothetical protein H0U74_09065 [Bradymonadaceae bacterium]|nr:hypothetical protein [Lujinxingiaceae bacterium]